MEKVYRDGPLGALMDEYERASNDLKRLVRSIPPKEFIHIIDADSTDPDCRSVQSVLNHVVRSGYLYSNYIRTYFNSPFTERKDNSELSTPEKACLEVDLMLEYAVETLEDHWDLNPDDHIEKKIQVSWGQTYDLEQLLEHAIVHILRHRRQIERWSFNFPTSYSP